MSSAADHGKIRQETPATYYEEVVRIPGYGDAPNRCRPMKPVGFCEEGHPILGRSSCGVRYCPDHWRDWCEDAVISMVERLAAYREARDGWEKRMCHVAASPPPRARWGVETLWNRRSDAYEALEAAGVRGGAVVTHPYRTTREADRLFKQRDEEEYGDVGKWRYFRDLAEDLPGEDWDELEQYIEASPHYHALAAVEDVNGENAPGDWVVENIRSFDPFQYTDSESYEDMVRTAYYVLTHGAVQQGRSTSTYFGEIHPNAFDPEEELTVAKWSRIQMEAERAVKGHAEETDQETVGEHGPEECPVDGCEACVIDVVHLPEYLDDDEFVSRVLSQRDGRKRLKRLRGMYAWWDTRTDRPPPGALTNERRLLDWLEDQGETFTPDPKQVRLQTAVMG